MIPSEFADRLKRLGGTIRAEPIHRDVLERVMDIEASVVRGSCGICIENPGIATCASKRDAFVLFCDGTFARPSEISMEMVDDRGVVIGHDVPPALQSRYRAIEGLFWLSDNFVVFPDRVGTHDASMVMRATRLDMDVPEGVDPWIFYPSPESAGYLGSLFGVDDGRISAAVVGVDGLEGGSVPVADVVEVAGAGRGHGEPAAQDALYRGYLVGEPLQVPELPLADQDLHALVVVEVHVDGGVDHALVVVLDVGELVAHGGDGVVIDHDDGADHPLVVVLPFGLGEGVAYQVPDRLRPADIALLGDRFVELLEQLRFQRDADARHSFHAVPIGVGVLTFYIGFVCVQRARAPLGRPVHSPSERRAIQLKSGGSIPTSDV